MDFCNLAKHLANTNSQSLVLVENQILAQKLFVSIHALSSDSINKKIILLPDRETLPYQKSFTTQSISAKRFKALYEILDSQPDVIITTIASSMHVVPPKAYIKLSNTILSIDDTVSLSQLIDTFAENGFQRTDHVSNDSDFSVKGSVLEFQADNQLFRLEWFDDTIENIWLYDKDQDEFKHYSSDISLLPQNEIQLHDTQREALKQYWLDKDNLANTYPEFKYIDSGLPIEGIEDLIPIIFNKTETIFEYLAPNTKIYGPKNIDSLGSSIKKQAQTNYELLLDKPFFIPPSTPETIICDNFQIKEIKTYDIDESTLPFKTQSFEKRLIELSKHKTPVIITCSTSQRLKRLQSLSNHIDLKIELLDTIKTNGSLNQLSSLIGDFCWPHQFDDYLILPEYELYKKNINTENPIQIEKVHLLPNDYVVHENYGIGQYLGLVIINEQEFMQVMFKKQAKIFISVDQFHLLSKYHIQENVILDEMGSKAWQKTAKKAKTLTYDYAAEILKVNAKRHILKTSPISVPSEYNLFKDQFPYTETPDQEKAIQNTLQDLNKKIPMDRLICGDVGFGKTEIAIRACFNVAMNQKQVLFVAPTTLLASQHFKNIQARFDQWPINVCLLTAQTKSKSILDKIRDGCIDVIVTTHVVLRSALQYNKLALIIIDEEHRFGVKDKEFIKQAHPNIHYLSMSATPIPRSLNFALSSLRDISLISTPPQKRTNVITQVLKHNDEAILTAIERELQRGGQVYMVHNDVSTITKVCEFWSKKSNYIVADFLHGKMNQLEQDEKMFAFSEHKINLLVATTIIESGIDIPNANTMIVLRADKFGLAQLHQLRGRVGRSDRQAFAYFITPDPIFLKKNALSRLNAINALTSLGSGYQLAVHDLEIRGTGSILGEEQSGMVKGVGYELYLSMLKQACKDLNLSDQNEKNTAIEYQTYFSLIIPDDYVRDANQRLSIYQTIAKCDQNQLSDIESNLAIQYGAPPYSLMSLLKTKTLANHVMSYGCNELIIKKAYALLTFTAPSQKQHEFICNLIQKNDFISLTNHNVIKIIFRDELSPHEIIDILNTLFS